MAGAAGLGVGVVPWGGVWSVLDSSPLRQEWPPAPGNFLWLWSEAGETLPSLSSRLTRRASPLQPPLAPAVALQWPCSGQSSHPAPKEEACPRPAGAWCSRSHCYK